MPEPLNLQVASPAVVLDGVNPALLTFVAHLDMVHQLLFGGALLITSGKDSIHAAGSLHAQGKAVDVRIKDLDPAGQLLFFAVLAYAAPDNAIAVFDERALGAESHIHIEYHGA